MWTVDLPFTDLPLLLIRFGLVEIGEKRVVATFRCGNNECIRRRFGYVRECLAAYDV